MKRRDAERRARAFLAERWPELADWNFDMALEHDGERRKSWSFGVRPDEEDPAHEDNAEGYVGYVHADGSIEGLY
jgi:hypothetical protein